MVRGGGGRLGRRVRAGHALGLLRQRSAVGIEESEVRRRHQAAAHAVEGGNELRVLLAPDAGQLHGEHPRPPPGHSLEGKASVEEELLLMAIKARAQDRSILLEVFSVEALPRVEL